MPHKLYHYTNHTLFCRLAPKVKPGYRLPSKMVNAPALLLHTLGESRTLMVSVEMLQCKLHRCHSKNFKDGIGTKHWFCRKNISTQPKQTTQTKHNQPHQSSISIIITVCVLCIPLSFQRRKSLMSSLLLRPTLFIVNDAPPESELDEKGCLMFFCCLGQSICDLCTSMYPC